MLPYDANHPPHTVVHLRVPDDTNGDRRKGLDEASFQALGRLLPSDTYLVTNRVAYYDYFREKFGWRHPHWSEIFHTALGRSWGGKDVDGSHHFFESPAQRPDTKIDRKQHIMENWADWYTILCATMVYHTHSDFSISAVHWQNVPSKSIDGMQGVIYYYSTKATFATVSRNDSLIGVSMPVVHVNYVIVEGRRKKDF